MWGIVDDYKIELVRLCLPLDQHEILRGRILWPGSVRLEQLRAALPNRRVSNPGQKLVVHSLDFTQHRLIGASQQLDRAFAARAHELTFMQETHSRQTKNNHARRAVLR